MAKKKNAVRADGRIAVQIYLGRGEDGKRKYKTVYGATQKEADEKALQVRLALRKGIDVTAERDTFSDWADRWIKIKATEVSRSQADVYRSMIRHCNRLLGDMSIGKLKPVDLQEVITDLAAYNPNTRKPASKRTLEVARNTASQIFELAIENRVLDYNPATAVKIPRDAPAQKRRALTAEEQSWILDTEHTAKRAAMIMMYSGLRRGELIPLMWSDVDLPNRTININKSVEKTNDGRFQIKYGAKTKSSVRVIDIPKVLADYLAAEPKDGLFVCMNAQGAMHTESSWVSAWNSYLADLNIKYGDFTRFAKIPKSKYDPTGTPFVIPRITGHWLRHTFATMLYFAGVDILTAKEQLGHSDIKTTLGIYTHLDQEHKRRSMDKLDDYLERASQIQVK